MNKPNYYYFNLVLTPARNGIKWYLICINNIIILKIVKTVHCMQFYTCMSFHVRTHNNPCLGATVSLTLDAAYGCVLYHMRMRRAGMQQTHQQSVQWMHLQGMMRVPTTVTAACTMAVIMIMVIMRTKRQLRSTQQIRQQVGDAHISPFNCRGLIRLQISCLACMQFHAFSTRATRVSYNLLDQRMCMHGRAVVCVSSAACNNMAN